MELSENANYADFRSLREKLAWVQVVEESFENDRNRYIKAVKK